MGRGDDERRLLPRAEIGLADSPRGMLGARLLTYLFSERYKDEEVLD